MQAVMAGKGLSKQMRQQMVAPYIAPFPQAGFVRWSLRVSVTPPFQHAWRIRVLAIPAHLSWRDFLSEYRQRTTVVTTIRAKQVSMNTFPPSNKSTGGFLRSGSVKRLCQKSAA